MKTIILKNKVNILYIFVVVLFFILNSTAFSQYFGKNKTQYKVFDWKYIESKHFDIYYDKGSKYLAEFSAEVLEEALISVQNTLDFQITQRIAVIVYDSHNDFQQTNVINIYLTQGIGGLTELYKNRVVVPFQGDYNQFKHVLRHELVHAVINDMFYGGRFQTAVTASGIFYLPIWLNEGLAEWESLNGMNIETDMFMRDLAINDEVPGLEDINGYAAYRCGQTFYSFIADRYGKGKITEFINKLKNYRNLNMAFENSFGMNIEDFSEQWIQEIKKRYWPDINIYKSPKDFSIALTNHKKENCFYFSSPAISPNGDMMAYISDMSSGIFSLYVAPVENKFIGKDTVKPKKLVSSARQNDFEQLNILTPGICWSPDNKSITISAKSGGEDAIFIIDAKTGKYEKIKPGFSSITSVIWSPDGKKIAFVGIKNLQSDLFYYDLETETVYSITNDVFTDKSPTWSNDSKTIFFISDRGENFKSDNINKVKIWNENIEKSDIYSVNIYTNEIKRITNEPEIEKISIVVSNDNKKLLYVSTKNGIGNIYEYIIEKNIERPLTNSANGITQLSLSYDNLNLIYSAQINGGYDIFLIRNPFETQLNITNLPKTSFLESIDTKNNFIVDLNDDKQEEDTLKISYGNFIIDFSAQEFIKPNVNIVQKFEQKVVGNNIDTSKKINDYIERDYKVDFSLDVLMVNPGVSTFYGVQGNGAIMFSDIMGNHQIYLQLYLLTDLKNSQVYATYLYNPKIIDYNISLYNSSAYMWNYLEDLNNSYLYSYRSTGVTLGASYAFDLFKRIEGKFNVVNAAKENTEIPSYQSINRFLLVPEIQFVFDNSLNGIYAPTTGTRLNMRALFSPKFSNNASEFFTLSLDARQYFELIPNFMSFAVRGAIGASFGERAQTFYMGGAHNWLNSSFKTGNFDIKEPEDFAFMQNFLMPLRGYSVCELMGNKYFMTNIEYRFPIFMALMTGGVPFLIQGVMGNLFLDVGGLWKDDFKISIIDSDGKRIPKNLLMSTGWGIRAIVFGLPVKFDMAWRNEFSSWSKPYYIVSLGLDF